MNFHGSLKKIFVALLMYSCIAQAQTLSPEDVQDLNRKTGIGCVSKKPTTEKADYYFVCKSRRSNEVAWNAAMYRSKVACSSDEISVFFNLNPEVPKVNGTYGAQIEVSCGSKP